MYRKTMELTISEFAKLHNINKRTLHYYDSIGLFSPNIKGENGYRYYNLSQSVEFEYILTLKNSGLNINEIQDFIKNPTPEKFILLSTEKEMQIDMQIKKLKALKKALKVKRQQLEICNTFETSKIEIIECQEENLFVLPWDFLNGSLEEIFSYMRDSWNIHQIRTGIGRYISNDKILKNDFDNYDGIYTHAIKSNSKKNIILKPAGKYICCYHKGSSEYSSQIYKKLISYANEHKLKLVGYGFEYGMNTFAISKEEDYIKQIMIKVEY